MKRRCPIDLRRRLLSRDTAHELLVHLQPTLKATDATAGSDSSGLARSFKMSSSEAALDITLRFAQLQCAL